MTNKRTLFLFLLLATLFPQAASAADPYTISVSPAVVNAKPGQTINFTATVRSAIAASNLIVGFSLSNLAITASAGNAPSFAGQTFSSGQTRSYQFSIQMPSNASGSILLNAGIYTSNWGSLAWQPCRAYLMINGPWSSASQQPQIALPPASNGDTPILLGVHRAPMSAQPVVDYENWLGRKMDVVIDTIPGENWGNIAVNGLLPFLKAWKGYESRLVIAIPMLPTGDNAYGNPMKPTDAQVSANLLAGANGAYDHYWHSLRDQLISNGFGNNVLRIGWELNGNWYNWRAGANPTAFVNYWRRIVTILRAHPSAKFKFNFNVTVGASWGVLPDKVYPGDAYVDQIGLDVYDTDWTHYPIRSGATPAEVLTAQTKVWNDVLLNGSYGLTYWSNFAKAHNKAFTIPEYGLWDSSDGHGSVDNTFFIQKMYDYVRTPSNRVSFAAYFDKVDGSVDGEHTLCNCTGKSTVFPKAAVLFRNLFGGGNPRFDAGRVTLTSSSSRSYSAKAGGTVNVPFNFSVGSFQSSLNYSIFVHVVDANGKVVFQGDFAPSTGSSSWKGNVSFTKTLPIPSTVAPGTYKIRAGLYKTVVTSSNVKTYPRAALIPSAGVTSDNSLWYLQGSLIVAKP